MLSINIEVTKPQHTPVLIDYMTFMVQQICTSEPSFFKTTSGMHRYPFEGWYLVQFSLLQLHCN